MPDGAPFWTVLVCMDPGAGRQAILDAFGADARAHPADPQDDLAGLTGRIEPDLLLFSSPTGGNLALLRSARAAHPRLSIVVLALAGTLAAPGFLEKLGELGVTRFIELPVEPSDLARRARGYLRAGATPAGPRRAFAEGEVVFLENDVERECFLVHTGRITIGKPLDRHRLHPMLEAGPGDILGEGALLAPGRRTATAIAAEPVIATVLTPANLAEALAARPAIALRLLDVFVRRHAEARARLDPTAHADDWFHAEASHFSGRPGLRSEPQRVKFGAGQVLLEPGASVDALYWIVQGQVQVQALPAAALEAPVTTTLGPGSPLGEVAFLTGEPLDNGAMTLEETTVAKIPRERFVAAVTSRPQICLELVRSVAARVRALREAAGLREVLELA